MAHACGFEYQTGVQNDEDSVRLGVSPDGKTLYYNPVFWKKLSAEEQIAVQIHEMLHIVYQHTERRKNREQARWNLACDMAINEQIRMAEYQLPEGAIEGENDTAENIYERIKTISFLTEGKSQKDAYIKAICADIEKNAEENVMAGDLLPYNADGTQCSPENETLNAIELSKQMAGAGTTTLVKTFFAAERQSRLEKYIETFGAKRCRNRYGLSDL